MTVVGEGGTGYERITAARLLSEGLEAPRFTERPWVVRWDLEARTARDLLLEAMPEELRFRTSGTTGEGRTWVRSREQLWDEAGLVADMLAGDDPEAVLSFAPPRHLYGMIVSVLVPARLGLPVWYRPQFAPMPEGTSHERWAVMAIPWTYRILRRRSSWTRRMRRLSLVHSTAKLPTEAVELLEELGDSGSILELLGSTETGVVATRHSRSGDRHWRLCPDFELVRPRPGDGEEPLVVSGPRLARPTEGGAPTEWRMDDYVTALDGRTIEMTYRRGRLVKVNGRRFDLDALEELARSALPCSDLACVPVTDPVIGEHFDLLLVPRPGDDPARIDPTTLLSRLPCRPRRIAVVEGIDRSDTGKLRRLQPDPGLELRRISAK
ncbi:AMP-binding protein [Nocardiopsis alba]|uniref:AMP-binding protein n=1 Tax=Nocardiopsis alba TaxID=53437 RepID=UPI0005A8DCBD|nr:AMP-binding protein [Nocardiopsis alba]